MPSESQHLFALTILVGLVCGVVAVAFHLSIKWAEARLIDQAMHAPGSSWVTWVILSPTLGGLLAGVLLTFFVPGARGSGIPQVKVAFAREGGRVRFRDAFGKFCIAVMQIGSGASLGREGPTVQICAGATTLLARLTGLPTKNMRRLLPVGVAAGIAAAFNAPIAAVTFTIEEIVGSLDQTVLSGVVVAAALAAVIERGVLGAHPIIEVQQSYGLDHASSLLFFGVLGLFGGLVSVAFTDGLLTVRQRFRRLRFVPSWAHPAIGGLVTGVLAVVVYSYFGTTGVTGGGYETLGKALAGRLALGSLVALCVVKLVATTLSYSSGGAGGIFAPSLFVGAMLGGAVGYADVSFFHHEERQLGAFALVGMGAVFAGVIRAPMTSVLIIFEMTGGYGLVLPLMLANMTSYALARRLRPTPIYEALLEQDGITLPHASRPSPTPELTVGQAMTPLSAGAPLDRSHEPTVLARTPLTRALVQMNEAKVRQLVVLDDETASRVVGVLNITDVVRAHAKNAASTELPQAEALVGLGHLSVHELAKPVPVVTLDTKLDELVARLAGASSGAVLVASPDGQARGVVLLEQVRDFLGDEEMKPLLLAGDLMHPIGRAVPTDTVASVVTHWRAGDAAVLVAAEPTSEPRVLTRAALGELLMQWYSKTPTLG